MAKRKLYGAALAAHNRKRGRSTSTAMVRRSSTSLAARPKTKTRYIKVKAKRRSHRGGGGGGAILGAGSGVNGAIATLKHQAPLFAGAAVYGYLTGADTLKAVELRQATLDHIPTSAKLGKPLSHGLIGTLVTAMLPRGIIRTAIGSLSFAAMMRASHNAGVAGGDADKFAAMGDDGGGDFSGAIDVES